MAYTALEIPMSYSVLVHLLSSITNPSVVLPLPHEQVRVFEYVCTVLFTTSPVWSRV